jgi:DNA-binding response OmpR family regulator
MKILFIGNSYKVALALKATLEDDGFIIDIVRSGPDELNRVLTQTCDLAVLDRLSPDALDATGLSQRLHEADPHLPILMLTTGGQADQPFTNIGADTDDPVAVPFSFENLSPIRALLRRPANDVLLAADLQLNTVTKQTLRAGTPIDLTRTEYSILEYLLRHRGEIITKGDLVRQVWDYGVHVRANSVEARLTRLRGKIDKPFSGPRVIRTVHGHGYSIDV